MYNTLCKHFHSCFKVGFSKKQMIFFAISLISVYQFFRLLSRSLSPSLSLSCIFSLLLSSSSVDRESTLSFLFVFLLFFFSLFSFALLVLMFHLVNIIFFHWFLYLYFDSLSFCFSDGEQRYCYLVF